MIYLLADGVSRKCMIGVKGACGPGADVWSLADNARVGRIGLAS
jgi:hypothetical protein